MRVVRNLAFASVLFISAQALAQSQPAWLTRVNVFRMQAGVPPVVEDPELSRKGLLHAKYSVLNNVLQHFEEPGKPGYSAEGDSAARTSNGAFARDEIDAIDQWMQAPFHALGIIDPRLKTTGFGLYAENGRSSAWLNVIAGMGPPPADTKFPIYWPGNRMVTHILKHWGESPQPTHSCPGYSTPSGLPVLIQFKPGTRVDVTASSFTEVTTTATGETTTALQHCEIDERNFRYGDSAWQATGRSILASRNAVILLPRDPLRPGKIYRASITLGGTTGGGEVYSWQFMTAR